MKRILRRLCMLLALALLLPTALPVPAAQAASDTPKLIALTFDDGPSAYTEGLLDTLEQRGAAATFFMCGNNGGYGVARYGALVERMLAIGCEPGNHSYGHPDFSKLSAAQMRSQIADVEAILYRQAGAEYTEVVRIPYGGNTAAIKSAVPRPLIRWSIDPYDWKYRNADTVCRNVLNSAFDGGIILLHDIHRTSVEAVPAIIDGLRAQGYELVTVSELFRRRGVELQAGQTYFSAPNYGVTLPAYTAPEISVGERAGAVSVTVASRDPGLTFRYTTDGSVPTLKSPVYTEPLVLTADTNLRVAGFDRFATRTPVASRFIKAFTATPRVERWEDGLLSLSCLTEGASILYTTDGSDPRTSGTVYTAPFFPGAVTRAVAFAPGLPVSKAIELVRLPKSGSLFCDLPANAWYLGAVDDAAARGLMSGIGSWRFAPELTTTRAVIVTTLFRFAQAAAPQAAPVFSDVPDGEWYADAVRWAASAGVVNGVGGGRFAPDDPLTWEQAAAILRRFADANGIASRTPHDVDAVNFPGASAYAVEPLAWCAANGVPYRAADGSFVPTAPIPRADLAAMLSALCALKDAGGM